MLILVILTSGPRNIRPLSEKEEKWSNMRRSSSNSRNRRKKSQFVIRFQNLRVQISRQIPEEELKDIFLDVIHEPLRTSLALLNFWNQSLEEVIDKA